MHTYTQHMNYNVGCCAVPAAERTALLSKMRRTTTLAELNVNWLE